MTVLLGNGDGTFQNAYKVAWVRLNYSVASADFDDDGDKDLVATHYGMTGGCCIYGEVTVALGNGDGTFGAHRFIRVGSGHTGPSAVATADLDRDGYEDLVVSNSASDDVSVMLGNGDGTFGAAQNFPAGDLPAFVISPDLDADGVADLAVANQNSNNLSVLLNTTPQPSDPTAPVSTHTLSAQPNAAGWHKSNVTVNLRATDTGGSGVKEIRYSATGAQSISETVYNPQNPPVINIEGITTLSYSATDNADNTEDPKTFTIRLDKTAPQVTPGDVVSNVWRNSSLSAQFTASDGGSGLANSNDASFALTASEESGGASQPTVASRTVLDRAGNSTTRKVSALIDLSEPQTTASAAPQPNANGWNNSNVTFVLNATDTGGSAVGTSPSRPPAPNHTETTYNPRTQRLSAPRAPRP